jgi:hypothetical protein
MEMWTEVLGSERLTGAALDRLTHRCHILEAKGESFRLRDARRRQRRAAGTACPTAPWSKQLPQSRIRLTSALHFPTAPRCTFQPAFTTESGLRHSPTAGIAGRLAKALAWLADLGSVAADRIRLMPQE